MLVGTRVCLRDTYADRVGADGQHLGGSDACMWIHAIRKDPGEHERWHRLGPEAGVIPRVIGRRT